MNKGKIALVVAIGGFATYLFAMPYITVYNIKRAAENNNADELSEYIDFPSVRQSVKEQLTVSLAKNLAEDDALKDNPFAKLGALFGAMMVDKMVDAYVTPTGIASLMTGKKPELTSTGQGTIPNADKPTVSNNKSSDDVAIDASFSYESLHKFVVSVTYDGVDLGHRLTLRRHGLNDWKVTDIRIPLD